MAQFRALRKPLMAAMAAVIVTQGQAASAAPDVVADRLFDIRLRKSFGVVVGLNEPSSSLLGEKLLVGIDSKNLRKYDLQNIKRRLAGAIGTPVRLELGDCEGNIEQIKVVRHLNPTDPSPTKVDGYRFLDEKLTDPFHSTNLPGAIADNTDLIAIGNCAQAVEDDKDNPEAAIANSVNAMLLSQAMGDFSNADRYLARALDLIKREPPVLDSYFREKAAIQNLIALGKLEEAEALCRYLIQPDPAGHSRSPSAVKVLDSYNLIPSKSAKEASRELAGNIFANLDNPSGALHDDAYWFGQYLESQELFEQAIKVYSNQLVELQSRSQNSDIYSVHPRVFGLYLRARLYALNGKQALAASDLQSIKTVYKTLPAKQQNLIQRLPQYFPTAADVDQALVCLHSSKPLPAAPQLYSYSNQDAFVNQPSTLSLHLAEALRCLKSIKENQKADAVKLSQQLANSYGNAGTLHEPLIRQNLFCTCLRIGRGFADKGWYDAVGSLLAQLEDGVRAKTPEVPHNNIAFTMLAAERIYNATASGSKTDWSLLRTQNAEERIRDNHSLSWPDELCALAAAYNYAGEYKRAKLFIDKSIAEQDDRQLSNNAESTPDLIQRKVIQLFTAAAIYAKLSDIAKANEFVEQAFKLQFSFNDRLAKTLLEIATTYSDVNKIDQAIAILVRCEKTDPSYQELKYIDLFDTKLAKLYQKNGQLDKALSVMNALLTRSRDSITVSQHLLAAELLDQSGNFKDASMHFYEAGKSHGDLREHQREQLLLKAIDRARRGDEQDKSTLRKALLELSAIVGKRSTAESLSLRQSALQMIADNDPEKPSQLSAVAFLKQASYEQSAKTSDGDVGAAANEWIIPAKQAAELATINKSSEASDYWMRLANSASQAGKYTDAMTYAREGINAYHLENVPRHSLYDLLPSGLPSIIAAKISPEKAEQLMREAQQRVELLAGPRSLQAQTQMSHYFEYLLSQPQDFARSEKMLDALLATSLNQGRYAPPNHDRSNCHFASGPLPVESSKEIIDKVLEAITRFGKKDSEHALLLLNKVLQAEFKQYGKDDYRVAMPYVAIARTQMANKDDRAAFEAYASAIAIMHRKEKLLDILHALNPDYYDLLRRLKKNDEVDLLEKQKQNEMKANR